MTFKQIATSALITAIIALSANAQRRYNPATDNIVTNDEFRAAWLTTVKGIDWPRHDDSTITDQEALVKIIKDIKDVGCNVVLFQVISNMDAVYPSAILPWSHVLTGVQGQDPGYDPLKLAIETCRSLDLEIHAWMNPLRCGAKDMERDSSHVVLSRPELIQEYKDMYYLDPALPEVREHLASLVKELMDNYDLDGVHIDDYFYPAGFQTEQGTWKDDHQYEAYQAQGGTLDLEGWRFANINACVKAMYDATHESYPGAQFGISPGGRLVNTVALYADPRYWVEEGTIDYLIPQIYWQHGHPIADFPAVMASWEEILKDVPMYTGLAAYRYGQKGFESTDEFDNQIRECREASWVYGQAWFSTKCILTDVFRPFLKEGPYKYEALPPAQAGYVGSDGLESAPVLTGNVLSWEAVPSADSYVIYKLFHTGDNNYEARIIGRSKSSSFDLGSEKGEFAVMALSGRFRSPLSPVVGRY